MGTVQISSPKGENTQTLAGIMKSLEDECKNCAPTTPLECISRCQVYKLKNELRNLRETMNNPDYMKELFNVLKNETRFYVLETIVNDKCSVTQLQRVLKKTGYNYSSQGFREEYLLPLIRVGLATEAREEYGTTMFGGRLAELLQDFSEFVEKLPARSECYEEVILQKLLEAPKTFEEIETLIPLKSTSRTLKRLRSVGLIETPDERDYVFYFKTIRDPNKETITAPERKVYDALMAEGSSAGKLAKATGLSVRRIYKCIRVLKGKKLIFLRRTPKLYTLTSKGEKLASLLREVEQIVEDTWNSSTQVMQIH
jgi:DNA-binding HxlR family transcriptional regulator